MSTNITGKAMLVAVRVSMWGGRKHDKNASRQVANLNEANEKAGRYNKYLLGDAPKLKEVEAIEGRIRQYLYKVTLPWTDEGQRILPSELYFEFKAAITEFEAEFNGAVAEFLDAYPGYIAEARPILGKLFAAEDYPDVQKLRERFQIKLDILPVPEGADFRVDMSQEEQERIAADINQSVRDTLQNGTLDLYKRLYKVIAKMAEKLSDPEAGFHKTLVSNVSDLADLLPQLNLAGNADLSALTEEVRSKLCQNSAEILKNSPIVRQETAASAASLARSIASTLGLPVNAVPTGLGNSPIQVANSEPVVPATAELPFASPLVAQANIAATADSIFARMAPFLAQTNAA